MQQHSSQIKVLSDSDSDSHLLLLVFAILIVNNTFILMSHIIYETIKVQHLLLAPHERHVGLTEMTICRYIFFEP